ncbi:hypothetical protein VCUG_00339 [Vavraia culicis subsp. floridensis]|uniref:Tubulin binding cofactor C-like domain-containing protein n=1 Tax=Vavraia culicis (isolate floridensis) TaxID=948595 RepID=L2GWP8_VAVCU|nr:uncharacterized protein VCUG_00339 [Vavraia culicis subsp. floridensis]ELA48101.1 hypothetical protein VCUG_00339 [Vavraia culicis subsp. floridensis]
MKDENECNAAGDRDISNHEIKSQIIILENKLKIEKVKYRQNVLIEQIKKLKELYVQNDRYNAPMVHGVAKLDISGHDKTCHSSHAPQNGWIRDVSANPASSCDTIVYLDKNNLHSLRSGFKYSKVCVKNIYTEQCLAFDCDELTINACSNLRITTNVSGSIFIENVQESALKINAGQIRLVGCRDLKLMVYTKSGISIENSERIIIEEWKIQNVKHENLFWKVNDFSDPFGDKNYTVIC